MLAAACLAQSPRDYTRWVNPFIGTGGHGHTFPGATVPFGMVQLSPDTRIDNWDGSSGYHYSDNIIYGFSHTHLSGTGIPDGCDILFMPTVGEPQFFAKEGDKSVNGYASKFSHSSEKAEPGYYSVKLDDDGILAELTSTKRVGLHRYTFPKSGKANLIIDLKWRDKVFKTEAKVVGNRIEGFRESSSWAKNQKVYFVAEFQKKINETVREIENVSGPRGQRAIKTAVKFNVRAGERVFVKVAISYVSIEGARKNLEAELPHWNFDKVRADAKASWNKELSKIEVTGGTDEQTTNFYTALYHTMIHPNVFNDVDGRYKGHDGKIHVLSPGFSRPLASGKPPKGGTQNAQHKGGTSNGDHYTVFSLWDTFRAAHPLYTIIDQKRTVDFINSFIRMYEQGGRLPVWELWGEETDTMIGYHAVSVIADAMAKGIKGFDYEKAYAAAKHSAELDHFGLAAYKRRGYISMEDENESVSKTLEYAYNDWCIAQMAMRLMVPLLMSDNAVALEKAKQYGDDMKEFLRRSRSYENLYDPATGFFRSKKNGGFVEPFAPSEVNFGFTEGNSWQYSFFVPHDVEELADLMGGRRKFAAKLDELFTTKQKLAGREQADLTGLIGQYAHGNEPSHHIPYLYNYANQPWKTQKYVRRIMKEFYKNVPDGLIGNEDCGQMSAWYVLSASGFYQVTPGMPTYFLGAPLFKEIKYRLENGKTFTVRAPNVSAANLYVRSVRLNKRKLRHPELYHSELINGGLLEFEMSSAPVSGAFTEYSGHYEETFTAVPIIGDGRRTFQTSLAVPMRISTPGSKIYYTLDGSEPTEKSLHFTEPITITSPTKVRAIGINAKGIRSQISEAFFDRIPNDWSVKVLSGYSTQYTGGGENAIVDGIRGTTNFASGEWQGIQGKPYEAIIDLKRETEIRELGGSFLQVVGPWIWMPDRIVFEWSNDGTNFQQAVEIKPNFPIRQEGAVTKEFRALAAANRSGMIKARYIRVRAYNFGKIPAWHLGAGGDPWIFIDEVFIR